MINFDFDNQCTGCRACGDACVHGCISFSTDADGFVMPHVDMRSCTDCHRCEKVCPVLCYQPDAYELQACYAAYHQNDQIRHEGSSGSAFYALAQSVITQGGVVYGAAMTDGLQLRHTRALTLADVRSQMKSKYIQSDTTGIYRQVLTDAREGRKVLFVGTPCQCQALHNSLPIRLRQQVLIVDFICHGVPSQHLFDQSISSYEEQHNCNVVDFSFREKTAANLRNYKIGYMTPDGTKHERIGDLDDIPFCFGYFNHITQRKSCYECPMRGVNRCSDLTVADFWRLQHVRPETDDFNLGYSSIITNTPMGGEMLANLSYCYLERIPDGVKHVVRNNHAYTKADQLSFLRTLFFWTVRHFGYATAERLFLQKHSAIPARLLKSVIIRLEKLK